MGRAPSSELLKVVSRWIVSTYCQEVVNFCTSRARGQADNDCAQDILDMSIPPRSRRLSVVAAIREIYSRPADIATHNNPKATSDLDHSSLAN